MHEVSALAYASGLSLVLRRSHAPDRVIGAGAQVDVEVVHVAGDVRIIAERRHHVGIWLVVSLIPDEVMAECRAKANAGRTASG